MKSYKTSKSSSPAKIITSDFSCDPHADFEAELNRGLGKQFNNYIL